MVIIIKIPKNVCVNSQLSTFSGTHFILQFKKCKINKNNLFCLPSRFKQGEACGQTKYLAIQIV